MPAAIAPPVFASRQRPTAAPSASIAPAGRYAAVFDDLVAKIERDHVFAPGYARDVGHAWRDDVPRLRDELAGATDREHALIALHHLENSLRDPHCALDPPADLRRRTLRLGIELWAGGTFAAPDVRISRVTGPEITGVAVGDAVTAIDGAPVPAWLAAHPFETRILTPSRALADAIAESTRAELPWSAVSDGDTRSFTIVHDGAAHDVELAFRDRRDRASAYTLDEPPPMAAIDCGPFDGDYERVDVGVNLCVYRPRAHPRIAIVRYRSFLYQGPDTEQALRMVKVDHDVLVRSLRDADGVVLDLHENAGGNNPFLFLGWFSSAPLDHPRLVVHVDPALDPAAISSVFYNPADIVAFANARRDHQASFATRFLCAHEPCTNVRAPDSERVTHAPVAVIVGPSCVSSCDTFASLWSAFHLGPIVGRQPLHAYTVIRLPIKLTGPDREDLGTFRLALSQSELRDGAPLEGEPVPLDWEAPESFEARTSWVRAAVGEATARLAHAPRPLPR